MNAPLTLETISPYLVVAQADSNGRPIMDAARALNDLIVTFRPQGYFAVSPVEDECGPAVHCAFECKVDADRLATAVGAIQVSRYEIYRSEQAFYLNESALQRIRGTLALMRR
jgi:hypothetical protein